MDSRNLFSTSSNTNTGGGGGQIVCYGYGCGGGGGGGYGGGHGGSFGDDGYGGGGGYGGGHGGGGGYGGGGYHGPVYVYRQTEAPATDSGLGALGTAALAALLPLALLALPVTVTLTGGKRRKRSTTLWGIDRIGSTDLENEYLLFHKYITHNQDRMLTYKDIVARFFACSVGVGGPVVPDLPYLPDLPVPEMDNKLTGQRMNNPYNSARNETTGLEARVLDCALNLICSLHSSKTRIPNMENNIASLVLTKLKESGLIELADADVHEAIKHGEQAIIINSSPQQHCAKYICSLT